MSEGKEREDTQGKDEEGQEKRTDFHRVQSSNFVSFYTNNVEIGFSAWDMRLIFGEIMGMKEGKVLTEERARIIMSLQHAKVFAALLVQQIEKIEQQFGEIQILSEKATDPSGQQQGRTASRVAPSAVEEKTRQRA